MTKNSKPANRKVAARVPVAALPLPVDKTRLLEMSIKPGQTESQSLAELVTRGTVGCASTVIDYAKNVSVQPSHLYGRPGTMRR